LVVRGSRLADAKAIRLNRLQRVVLALGFFTSFLGWLAPVGSFAQPQNGPPRGGHPPWAAQIASTRNIEIGGATLQVDLAKGPLDLPPDAIFQHVREAASAVVAYYGRFPVSRARVLIIPVEGRGGILQGTTWGDMGGNPGFTRFRIGEHLTAADLADDWMMTHELVHMAFPSMPDDQHWIEEGLSTYIEPLARVETGNLTAAGVWRDMVRDMPKGEPHPGDQGLDRTHTWANTYWGGALFCLTADVEIRRQTKNQKGLKDALRAIVAAGGTIDHEWSLDKAFAVGDQATGTHVLTAQYAAWKDAPVQVDLPTLWSELGIRLSGDRVEFVHGAPLENIRQSIAGPAIAAAIKTSATASPSH
jgi:hypothetical protein